MDNETFDQISLNDNQVTGTIPDSMGFLTKMFDMNLSTTLITGPIPSSMD